MLIQVGDAEILLDDSTRVAERARAAGVKVELEAWPEMFHVWHVFAKILPEGQQAIDRIGEYVRAHASPQDHEAVPGRACLSNRCSQTRHLRS